MAQERFSMMGIDSVITAGTAVAVTGGYYTVLLLQESNILAKFTNVDQWLGGGLLGGMVFFMLRWAFKRNDTLTQRIDALNDRLLEQREAHHDEIKQLLLERNPKD
jgi:hypothetical protein